MPAAFQARPIIPDRWLSVGPVHSEMAFPELPVFAFAIVAVERSRWAATDIRRSDIVSREECL